MPDTFYSMLFSPKLRHALILSQRYFLPECYVHSSLLKNMCMGLQHVGKFVYFK